MKYSVIEMKLNALNRPYYVLKNREGEIITVSESFSDRIACERGIIDVRENIIVAQILAFGEKGKCPSLEIREYLPERFQFILTSLQDEIILSSAGYDDINTCMNQMKEFKECFAVARIVDLL